MSVTYKQIVSFPGELGKAKLAKRILQQVKALNTATEATGKVDCGTSCDTAISAIDSLISTILD